MYSTIYLLNYELDNDVFYDDNCTTILSAPITPDIFQTIEGFLVDKEIHETISSKNTINIKIIPKDKLEHSKQNILSSYLKEVDKIHTDIINLELLNSISSLTKKGNIIELLRLKVEHYLDDENIIVMVR